MRKLTCLLMLLGFMCVSSVGISEVKAHSTSDYEVAYRIYSPQTGQHRYMTDLTRMNQLVIDQGWHLEKGHLLFSKSAEDYLPAATVLTLFSLNNQDILYTTNLVEVDLLLKANWQILLSSDVPLSALKPEKGVPVYRLYQPALGRHHFTAIFAERNQLMQAGWQAEGIAFYASAVS